MLPALIDSVIVQPDYLIGTTYTYCEIALLALYWLAFFVSLFNAKIVGAEMMGILQISFIGMIGLESRSSVIVGNSYLRYSDGWNPLFNDLGAPGPSTKATLMGFRSIFISDYNLMLVVLLLPPLVAICLYCF